jgi:c-di-GMP-binding flagellar brake protein YcgR
MPADNILYRSRTEIFRLLQALATEHIALSADIGTQRTFVTRILRLDAHSGYLHVAFSSSKVLNSALLRLPGLHFTANYHDAHVAFDAISPAEDRIGELETLRFPIPAALIYYHRRDCPRIPATQAISLRCIADEAGIIPFESRITDITHEGLGALLYDRGVQLTPLTVLKDSRIVLPNGRAVVADLEVRYVTGIVLPDGTPANRAGFRFIQRPDEIAEVIACFIQDLDKQPA